MTGGKEGTLSAATHASSCKQPTSSGSAHRHDASGVHGPQRAILRGQRPPPDADGWCLHDGRQGAKHVGETEGGVL